MQRVWNEQDFDSIERFVDDAYRIHPDNADPWEGKTLCHEAYRTRLKFSFGSFPDLHFAIHGLKDPWVPPGNVAYGKKMLVHAAGISELLFPEGNYFIPWTKFSEIKPLLMNLLEMDKAINK